MLARSVRGVNRLVGMQSRAFASDINHSHTALFNYHREKLNARFIEFAGYDMPVYYDTLEGGVKNEHLHTRASCGVFDVSHMGQVHFKGADASAFIERITVTDTQALGKGQATLSLLMNEMGGIKDDCIVTKFDDNHYYVVFNAGCKEKDLVHCRVHWHRKFKDLKIEHHSEQLRSLIAIQGPNAQHVVESVVDDNVNLDNLGFMESTRDIQFAHDDIIVTRCGYTGEDGFEISLPNHHIEDFMDAVLMVKDGNRNPLARPVGLGARDTLRLEAGLCLYGHELKEDISPVKAMLTWTISKRRKEELGFLGSDMVKKHMTEGVSRKRCGFIGDRVPIRENTELFAINEDGSQGEYVGKVTSGAVTPSVNKAIGMAYVNTPYNKVDTELIAVVRNKPHKVRVTKMPFIKCNYYNKNKQ
jgi:aminomethyltransferase